MALNKGIWDPRRRGTHIKSPTKSTIIMRKLVQSAQPRVQDLGFEGEGVGLI